MRESIEDIRRRMEKLLGYPPGAFEPARLFFEDAERVNKALGEGFRLMQEVISPLHLIRRIISDGRRRHGV